jgi:hypothetical protein
MESVTLRKWLTDRGCRDHSPTNGLDVGSHDHAAKMASLAQQSVGVISNRGR